MNPLTIMLFIILHIILLPISSIFFIILPKSKLGRFMTLPCVKFISQFASYLIFVGMIISSFFKFPIHESNHNFMELFPRFNESFLKYVNRKDLAVHIDFENFFFRENRPTGLEITISVWILGQTWHEIKQLMTYGINDYFYSSTNTFNLCMNVLYLSSFGLKYHTMLVVSDYLKLIGKDEFWSKVDHLNNTNKEAQKEVYDVFYWLNSDRFYWQNLDPINLSEGLFAIANIFTFTRLCFYLSANQQLGPLQITLGKMINDILKFIVIFAIIFASFVFGLNNLYWYYSAEVRGAVEITKHYNPEDPEHPYMTKAEEAFGS